MAGAVTAGCDEGRRDPPNATVRVVHAAPNVGPVTFRRVDVNATTLDYRGGTSFSFDADTYTFNIQVLAIDDTVEDTLSFEQEIVENNDYLFLLREINGVAAPRVIETASPGSAVSGTQSQLAAVHAATSLGPLDIYLDVPGFDPSASTPWGTADYDEIVGPTVFGADDYQIVLTDAGAPANVLLRTETFTLGGAQNLVLVVTDGAGQGIAPTVITVVGGGGGELADVNLESGIRVINTVTDGSAIDAGIDNELAPPVITDAGFATASEYAFIPPGAHEFNVTPAGNPGVVETEVEFTAPRGRLGTWFVVGDPGSLLAGYELEDRRVVAGESKISFYNAGTGFDNVQVFVAEPGADLDTLDPTTVLAPGSRVLNRRFETGAHEITVRDAETEAVVGGAVPVTLDDGGYYTILLTDTMGGGTVDVTLLDDFN
jgi:hypothetical protein